MADLKAALREAQKKQMFFAFVAKGAEGKLLVEKMKIPTKEIAEAKKASGGGTIFKGRCFYEDETMVFEVPLEPPGNLAALIKKIIKADATLTMNVVVRVNAALAEGPESVADGPEGDAGSAETSPSSAAESAIPPAPALEPPSAAPTAAAPSPPPQGSAEVIKRLNSMSAGIKTALAGPNKARVQALFVAVNGSIKSQDYVQADMALDELEPLIVATAAAPAAAPTPPQGGADVIKRLNAMSAGIKTALAGPDKARVQALFVAVNRSIKSQDYVQADKALDELEPLVAQTSVAGAAPNELAELYNGLRETIPADLQRLRAINSAKADQIRIGVGGAAAAAQNGDFQSAVNLLKQATDDIARAMSAARAQEAAEVIPEGKVAQMRDVLSRAEVRWEAALEAARSRMKPVQAELQEEYPDAVAGIDAILDSYWQDLGELLREGHAKQEEGELDSAVQSALAKVQNLRAEVHADALFSYLDQSGFQVQAVYEAAFDEVTSLLGA